jgi:hypothetical protein
MLKALITAVVALATIVSARADETYMFGIGRLSCANWTGNPAHEFDGGSWIMGYWSGLNTNNPNYHMAGHTTDATGVIAEVRLVCRQHPSLPLYGAIATVYNKIAERAG